MLSVQVLSDRYALGIKDRSAVVVTGETLIDTSFDTSPVQQTATVGNAGSAKTAYVRRFCNPLQRPETHRL